MHFRGDYAALPHPWRELRRLSHVTLRFAVLPAGLLGLTCHRTATITLAHGLTQAERRSTLAHELQHLARGPVPRHLRAREEAVCDSNAARALLPDVRAVGEALAWAGEHGGAMAEGADELWVDEATLRARLSALHPAERAYLHRRLSHP